MYSLPILMIMNSRNWQIKMAVLRAKVVFRN
jgi:hypothetical protein